MRQRRQQSTDSGSSNRGPAAEQPNEWFGGCWPSDTEREQAEAVVFDFMNPVRPNGRLGGRAGQARFDEAARAGGTQTPQHGR